jgi:hypothetical protein
MSRYWAATERRTSYRPGVDGVPQPIHELAIVSMGMPIFDNCDKELIGPSSGGKPSGARRTGDSAGSSW